MVLVDRVGGGRAHDDVGDVPTFLARVPPDDLVSREVLEVPASDPLARALPRVARIGEEEDQRTTRPQRSAERRERRAHHLGFVDPVKGIVEHEVERGRPVLSHALPAQVGALDRDACRATHPCGPPARDRAPVTRCDLEAQLGEVHAVIAQPRGRVEHTNARAWIELSQRSLARALPAPEVDGRETAMKALPAQEQVPARLGLRLRHRFLRTRWKDDQRAGRAPRAPSPSTHAEFSSVRARRDRPRASRGTRHGSHSDPRS